MGIKNIKLDTSDVNKIIQFLQNGSLKISGQAVRGSNSTFLCEITAEEESIKAIYKPSKGERPLWDFPDFTLAQREVAAFIVSSVIGWDFVPPTIFRTQPAVFGSGSLQLYIEHNPGFHYLNAPIIDDLLYMKIVTFDLLVNNADRKSGHVIFDLENNPWLIDHGLSFNIEDKHRTVIWDYAGQNIPDVIKNDIHKFNQALESNKFRLVKKLKLLLSENEFASIIQRGKYLLAQGQFPFPEPNRRSYPWPPI
jgi:hypothetical protein